MTMASVFMAFLVLLLAGIVSMLIIAALLAALNSGEWQ